MSYLATNRGSLGDRLQAPEILEGYGLCDPVGRRIGKVKKVFVNGDGEPEYVSVRMGLFGARSALIPVQSIVVDELGRTVTLA